MKIWDGHCGVTGFDISRLLRASHIKPWRDSNNAERLDPYNGLLLSPGFDAAFDAGYVSFDNDGALLMAPRLPADLARLIGIVSTARRFVAPSHLPYLAYHRDTVLLR